MTVNWFAGIFNMFGVALLMYVIILSIYVLSFLWEFILEPILDWLLDKLLT